VLSVERAGYEKESLVLILEGEQRSFEDDKKNWQASSICRINVLFPVVVGWEMQARGGGVNPSTGMHELSQNLGTKA
jgi:hypothetical protein